METPKRFPALLGAVVALASIGTVPGAQRPQPPPPAVRGEAAPVSVGNYIVVRLDEVRVLDDNDTGEKGPEGEIQYLAVVATGDRGGRPAVMQKTVFPMENWYEACDDGVNASFMSGAEQAVPIFSYPENRMGEELLITVAILDDDETSSTWSLGHKVVGKVATAVTTAFAGPWGKVVDEASSGVQAAIESSSEKDVIGTYTTTWPRSGTEGATFGMLRGRNSMTQTAGDGNIRITYTIMRVSKTSASNGYYYSIVLEGIRILDDSDNTGDGEIYVRARGVTGFADNGEMHQSKVVAIPNSGTVDVEDGRLVPGAKSHILASGMGLPVFAYVEVDVFEDDSGIECSGRTCDEALGVLPLMFTNTWLREHIGRHPMKYVVKGNDGKAEVLVNVEVKGPKTIGPDPDAQISRGE